MEPVVARRNSWLWTCWAMNSKTMKWRSSSSMRRGRVCIRRVLWDARSCLSTMPCLRSAISIGRRLLDPLSELVKINPANIGVGMYQHDVKAKHLRNSLDAVVESCVNYVGVDVNTASPALVALCLGNESAHGATAVRVSVQTRAVSQSRRTQASVGTGRSDLRPGRRVSQDHPRRQPARCHLDSPGKLRAGPPGPGEGGLQCQ